MFLLFEDPLRILNNKACLFRLRRLLDIGSASYLKVIAKKVPDAIHILDRFYIMQKMGKMLRKKRELILNWFIAEGKLSSVVVEGFNKKLKLMTRKPYGFRTQRDMEPPHHKYLVPVYPGQGSAKNRSEPVAQEISRQLHTWGVLVEGSWRC